MQGRHEPLFAGMLAALAMALLVLPNWVAYRPNRALWHFNRSLAYAASGDAAAEMASLRQVLEQAGLPSQPRMPPVDAAGDAPPAGIPYAVSACNNLGNRAFRRGELREAEAWHRQALHLHPENVDALSNLAIGLLAQGRPRESRPYFEQALRLDPDRTHLRHYYQQARETDR